MIRDDIARALRILGWGAVIAVAMMATLTGHDAGAPRIGPTHDLTPHHAAR